MDYIRVTVFDITRKKMGFILELEAAKKIHFVLANNLCFTCSNILKED